MGPGILEAGANPPSTKQVIALWLPGLQATRGLALSPQHHQLRRDRWSSEDEKLGYPLISEVKTHTTGHYWSVLQGRGMKLGVATGLKSVWFHRPLELMGHRIRDGGSEANSPPMDGQT